MAEAQATLIKIVAGITVGAILISLFLIVLAGRGDMTVAATDRVKTMDIRNRDNDYLQYSGSILDGTKVRSLIKGGYGQDIVMEINTIDSRGNRVTITLDYRTNTYKSSTKGTRTDFYDKSSGKNIPDLLLEVDSGWYINPMDTFECQIEMTNGVIDKMVINRA